MKLPNVSLKSLVALFTHFFIIVTVLGVSANLTRASTSENPFSGKTLFVDPDSQAYEAYLQAQSTNSSEAKQIKKIADTSQAAWFMGSSGSIEADVNAYVTRAADAHALPVLVAYNIPQRDCSGYSAGGIGSPDEYRRWIADFAKGIQNRNAVIIFEPDGLGLLNCLSSEDQSRRLELYRYALDILTKNPNITVYIDASMWVSPNQMAGLLRQAGIEKARGIAVNTSGYQTPQKSTEYIKDVQTALGMDIHGVIDTSRNGNGPDSTNEWCNPQGRALGAPSTADTGDTMIDAFFWVKRPGESDGDCNGGPRAGQWWQSYAVELAARSPHTFIQGEVSQTQISAVDQTSAPTTPSQISIFAAGTPAFNDYPSVELLINDIKVQTFYWVAGNPYNREFVQLNYLHPDKVHPEQVSLRFINDATNAFEDRNLIIDRITIDGVEYQTESPSTYSTGTWSSDNGCQSGNKQSEWLHCNGFVQFAR